MIENSSHGLVMLGAETAVTVTREDDHQAELSRYPVAPGLRRHVAVELAWCTISTGKYQGERAIEVRLDGRRVGELTHLMSQRYAPLLDLLSARGGRAGCEAVIQAGVRGAEVVLRLPREDNLALPPAPTATFPPVATAVPIASAVPMAAVAQPTSHPAPPRRSRFARNRPAWIAGAAVAAVVFIAAIANAGTSKTPAANLTTTAPTTTTTTTTARPTTTTTTPTPTTAVPAAPPQITQAPVTQAPVAQPPAAKPTTEPVAPPPAEPACHPNYSGCVPIASDVDCAGGSGDGPAYVRGPIQVLGPDVYRLDNDKDGIACE